MWTAADVPGQQGRTAVVTGANSGIGFETALALAQRAATDPAARGGDYYGPGGRFQPMGYPVRVESSAPSHDRAAQERLWGNRSACVHARGRLAGPPAGALL